MASSSTVSLTNAHTVSDWKKLCPLSASLCKSSSPFLFLSVACGVDQVGNFYSEEQYGQFQFWIVIFQSMDRGNFLDFGFIICAICLPHEEILVVLFVLMTNGALQHPLLFTCFSLFLLKMLYLEICFNSKFGIWANAVNMLNLYDTFHTIVWEYKDNNGMMEE